MLNINHSELLFFKLIKCNFTNGTWLCFNFSFNNNSFSDFELRPYIAIYFYCTMRLISLTSNINE